MAASWKLLPLVFAQQVGQQRLQRVPEPSGVTDADDNVLQYDRVMSTKLAVAYGADLEMVHQARPREAGGRAIDLACGPGHYTLCLAQYLAYDRVTGVDLSPGMVEVAEKNAAERGLSERVAFQQGDITHLESIGTDEFDLASFTGAAHHMPDLDTVSQVIREMDRIARPEGLVMVMDLVRLRSAWVTERYVKILGHDYVERGLPNFLEDFRNSMYASWTPKELHQAIPRATRRHWCHLIPRGLPGAQVILGLPVGRKELFVRKGSPWPPGEGPVPREMQGESWILRTTLRLGARRWVPPQSGPV